MDTDPSDTRWVPPPPHRPQRPVLALGLPADAPSPPPLPPRRRGRRRLLLAAVLSAVLAVSLGVAATGQLRRDRAPQAVVARYFDALANGDAAGALALTDHPAQAGYLTDLVLKQQLAVAGIDDVRVHGTAIRAGVATTQLSYRLLFHSGGDKQVDDAVELVRAGSSWRLRRASAGVTVTATSAVRNRLRFAGRGLPTSEVQLFPGALPLSTDSSAVLPVGLPALRLIDDGQHTDLSLALSTAAKQSLAKALTAALTGCLRGSSKDPFCPQPDETRPIPGSLRGSQNLSHSDTPTFELSDSADGRIELTDNVSVTGSWSQWDFNNQSVKHSGEAEVKVQAEASVADLATIYWVAP